MSPRFLFLFPLVGLAGCSIQTNTSEMASSAATALSSLPRQRQKAQMKAAFQAELLRPAPSLSELASAETPNFAAPPPGAVPANYIASLSAGNISPKRGLIICDPQSTTARDFGVGCARWMNVAGAGSTAFEVVPTWGMVPEFLLAQKWTDMALERGRAVQLARAMDASHVAYGSFDGKRLQYQVLDVQKMPSKVVSSFAISGSAPRIVAQLPGLAQQLVGATGAKGALIPASVGLSATDLGFLGSLPRDEKGLQKLSEAQLKRVSGLASQPLGAIFVGRIDDSSDAVFKQAAQTLLKIAPTNALAAGEVARRFQGVELERRAQVLRVLDQKFPHNECVALGNAALRGEEEDYFAQTRYAERAVRIAPNAPAAWFTLSQALMDQADEKRQGAYAPDMNHELRDFVLEIYPRAQAAAWKAVNLDSSDADLWVNLSTTSAFNGDDKWSHGALTEALKRNPQSANVLNWGLQIFQPKWGGDAASFATMARLAVANAGPEQINVLSLREGLKNTGQENLYRPLLKKLIGKQPDHLYALLKLSYVTRMETGDFKAALPYARRALQLDPDNTQSLTELADIQQHDLGQYAESIKLFRRAIKLEPKNPLHWVNMALSYAKWGKKSEARTYAVKGHALGYSGPHPVWNMVGLGPDGGEPAPTTPPSPPLVAH